MTRARPMLAEVLAVLTGLPLAFWRPYDPARVVVTGTDVSLRAVPGERGWAVGPILWSYPDPAEAWEVLGTHGIIPMDYAGRFLCACPECAGALHERPTSLPDLVAWASLGFAASDEGAPGIYGMEEEIALAYPAWQVEWAIAREMTFSLVEYGSELRFPRDGAIAIVIAPIG